MALLTLKALSASQTDALRAGRLLALRCLSVCLALCMVLAQGCASPSPDYTDQQVFARPEAAVTALKDAVNAADDSGLRSIFGSGAKDLLSSGDPIQDRRQREVFKTALEQKWTLERVDGSTRELIVGDERWPFAIPLVNDSRGWWFNTVAGQEEILARRIGRNELAGIGALRAFVRAQREYASAGRDGKPAGIYAQRIRSQPGKNDGLYWPVESEALPPSPLGEFASAAFAQGYGNSPQELQAPYQGYYFRFLKGQGNAAPGGAKTYLSNGEMTGGFAMIAFPAEYGNSGIMSFLVGPDGVVRERDLGTDTSQVAGAINEFNPEHGWEPVE